MLKKFTKKSIVPFFIALPVLAVVFIAIALFLSPVRALIFPAQKPTVTANFKDNATIGTLTIGGLEAGYYHIKLNRSRGRAWPSGEDLHNDKPPGGHGIFEEVHKVAGGSLTVNNVCDDGHFPKQGCTSDFGKPFYFLDIYKCHVPIGAVNPEDQIGVDSRCEGDPAVIDSVGGANYEFYGRVGFAGPSPADLRNYNPRIREARIVYDGFPPVARKIQQFSLTGLTLNRNYYVFFHNTDVDWPPLFNEGQPPPADKLFSGPDGTITVQNLCVDGTYNKSTSCTGFFEPRIYELVFYVNDGKGDSWPANYWPQGGLVSFPGPGVAEILAKQPTYSQPLEFVDNTDGTKQVMIKKLTIGNLFPGRTYYFRTGSTWAEGQNVDNGRLHDKNGGTQIWNANLQGEITFENICDNGEFNRGDTDQCEDPFDDPVYTLRTYLCISSDCSDSPEGGAKDRFVLQGRDLVIAGAGAPSLDVPCSGTECLTAIGRISTDPVGFIKNIFNFALGIAGGIAFLIMVYGSFKMITSSGNAEALQQGRELITSAVAGLLFIAFSVLLLKIIGVDILGLPGFSGPFVR